jgi:hypothetical protein
LRNPHGNIGVSVTFGLLGIVALLIVIVGSLFAQAGVVVAVSDLYLGRPATIADCLRRAWSEIGTVFAVSVLVGLSILGGLLVVIVGGIYVICRLLVSIPAAIIEQRSAFDSLKRSWRLSQGNAGRAFVVVMLYLAISIGAAMLVQIPFGVAVLVYRHNESMLQFWMVLQQVANAIINIVVSPILLIATAIFYFDLRVRKEGFDVQFLLDPTSERVTPPSAGNIPSILS